MLVFCCFGFVSVFGFVFLAARARSPRLHAFPAQVEGYIGLLRHGLKEKHVASVAMVRKVPEQLAAMLAELDEGKSAINTMVADAVAAASAGIDEGDGAKAVAAFSSGIRTVLGFFTDEYIPNTRKEVGCRGLNNGEHVYAHCLKYHTTTSMSAEEIHNEGLAEVSRIEARYQCDVMDKLGFKGTFAKFVEGCQDASSGHYYSSSEELLDGYRTLCKTISGLLPAYFNRIPAAPLEIVAKDAETAPAAYYMQGTSDGARPGRFYVNVSNLHQRPRYEMCALALHEAIPGHHHQGSLAIENEAIPSFLRFIEDRRYEFCPARRQLYASYLEGWALYCEALGEEMGMYTDPISLFGRLSMEMMRAVRLVVDTGIHAKGWTVERAIDYMMEKTGMHRHECEAECFRYEAWPGQACAYKVGEIAIWKMRRKAEAAFKAHGSVPFDLKQFHAVLLDSGPMPLDTLAHEVDEWVALLLE